MQKTLWKPGVGARSQSPVCIKFSVGRSRIIDNRMERGVHMTQQTFMYEAKEQVLIIHLPKELDHHNCRDLKYETDLLLAENYITKVVFDFSRTDFMDSSGIGILLNRYKQMVRSGGKVTLYGVNAQVGRVLAISGINRLMEHFDTKEAAVAG